MEKKLTKNEKGITLVALIITIIVLLILAVISIRAITGDNILGKSETAKGAYSEAEEKEKIQLAINQAAIDGMGTIKEDHLTQALNEQFGNDNWKYTDKKEGEYYKVEIIASQRKYEIKADGTLIYVGAENGNQENVPDDLEKYIMGSDKNRKNFNGK